MRSENEFGSTENVHDLERAASLLSGSWLTLKGLGRDSVGGLALMLVGGLLLYRGSTGHCPIYGSLGVSTAAPEGWPEEEGQGLDRVDEASDQSFPASDAPSWTPTSSVEPDQL